MTLIVPAARGQVRVVSELNRKLQFRQMNLIDTSYRLDRDIYDLADILF